MARLTNYDRERILKGLKPSLQQEANKVKKTLSELINKFFNREIPLEIFVFMKKYPKLVNSSKSIHVGLTQGCTYLDVIEYPLNYISDILKFALSKDTTGEISRTLDLLRFKTEEARILEKKISCILSGISTEKKLKDEFPEAYEVYTEDFSAEEAPQHMCDSVENVRAELSKLKK